MSVRAGLLSLLRQGPAYGFQLKTRFEQATGGVWPLNVGQVYTTLDRLERDGLVSVRDRDGQKVYELTGPGGAELTAWWDVTPADGAPPPRDELLLKVLLALPHGPDQALAVVTRQRSALVRGLQDRRRATGAPVDGDGLAAELVADAVLLRAEAELRWLDRCEARILAAAPDDRTRPSTANGSGRTDAITRADATDPTTDTRTTDRTGTTRRRRLRR